MKHLNRESSTSVGCSRREALCAAGLIAAGGINALNTQAVAEEPTPASKGEPRPWVKIRGIYGGFPNAILDRDKGPADYGVNAIWVGSGGLKREEIDRYHKRGLQVFAEFNSMHFAEYLKEHPNAAPIGADGRPSAPPLGWQGVSPSHAGYRKNRMDEFRRVLETFEIDGIWLDYHHSHASWERDEPAMPDTDFSPVALQVFTNKSGIKLPAEVSEAAKLLLGSHRDAWTQFRCDLFTDWVREYREILSTVRPRALLGTFHCPWSPEDHDGAIRHKLAIDLRAQAKYVDVFSIMPYHARFGHQKDPAWIARQTQSLGKLLGLKGSPDEKQKIWPIVQLADWGPAVDAEQVPRILDYGTRLPATGVMVFHWSGISQQWDKVESLGKVYRAMQPEPPPATTMSNPQLKFTRPEKPYAIVTRGDIEMIVVDNSAVNDEVLKDHRSGYSGVASLKHKQRRENLFVPTVSGLNFEHILDGRAQADRKVQFEPRNWPMELRVVGEHVVELYQKPTFHHGLESCRRYELLEDGTIQLTIEVIPRKKSFANDYICLFWASYIHSPESLDIHFLGVPAPKGTEKPVEPRWIRGITPAHGKLSTHPAIGDTRQFKHDEPFPLTLVYNLSDYRYSEPWYYGVNHSLAYAQMFRLQDNVRITQSPSGGGVGNPAWDFQFYIEKYEVDRRYQFVMRAAYLPYESHEQIEKATRRHREALNR